MVSFRTIATAVCVLFAIGICIQAVLWKGMPSFQEEEIPLVDAPDVVFTKDNSFKLKGNRSRFTREELVLLTPPESGLPYKDLKSVPISSDFTKILPDLPLWKGEPKPIITTDSYIHPLGACSKTIRVKNVSRIYVNGTRVWTHIFPDQRMKFKTHHERCHSVLARMLGILSIVLDELGLGSAWFLTHASLLGAVRHGGFIPWDNDIDIAMNEKAMQILERVWTQEFPRDMFLQTRVTDPKYLYQVGVVHDVFRVHDRYSCFPQYTFIKYKKRVSVSSHRTPNRHCTDLGKATDAGW
eukprot:PhF_6_TR42879/c0_g1_i1/m.64963